MLRRTAISTLLCLFSVLGASWCVADDAILKDILEMWRKRRESASTVRVRATGTKFIAKESRSISPSPITTASGDAGKMVPAEDIEERIMADWFLDFQEGRARFDFTGPIQDAWTGRFVSFRESFAYDSEKMFRISRNEVPGSGRLPSGLIQRQVDLSTRPAPSERIFFMRPCWPILLAHGVLLAADMEDISYDLRSPPLDASAYRSFSTSSLNGGEIVILRSIPTKTEKIVEINGRKITEIVSNKVTELFVDPRKHGAVVKMVCTSSGRPYFTFDIEHEQVNGEWLPHRWTLREYSPREPTAKTSYAVKVDSYTIGSQLETSAFVPEIRVGDLVIDASRKTERVRTKHGDILLKQLERDGLPRGYGYTAVYFILGLVLLAVSGFAIWRKVRKNQ